MRSSHARWALGEGTDSYDQRDSPKAYEPFRLKFQHRLVLELLVGSLTDRRQAQWRKFGHRTPTSAHQRNLADHQHEVTEPALSGVQAADLLSDGGPCEGFCDTLEDDRA